MEEFYTMNGGAIPPFGNWEYANEVARYLDCASQTTGGYYNCYSPFSFGDLYAVDFCQNCYSLPQKGRENVKTVYTSDQNHQTKQSWKQPRTNLNGTQTEATCQYGKPVDEDLYKIPPELIRAYRRKKKAAFFSRLVSACIR